MIVELVDLPHITRSEVGEALMLKFAGAVTVRVTVVCCVTLPPVPVTAIG